MTENKLYKYAKIDKRLYENLINGTLWFSDHKNFNDPFEHELPVIYWESTQTAITNFYDTCYNEGRFNLILNLQRDVFLAKWTENKAKLGLEIREALKKELITVGICCMSNSPIEVLMWSHYADAHKGICLEFDDSDNFIFENIQRSKVNYPPKNKIRLDLFAEKIPVKDSIYGMFLTKHNKWSYENEWRFLRDSTGLQTFNKKTLKSIIFGYYSTLHEQETINKLIQENGYENVIFKKIELEKFKYELKIVQEK